MSKRLKKLGGFLGTLALGAGIGMLISPDTGENNRKALKKKIDELLDKAKEIDLDEVKDELLYKVEVLKKELASLDKEKAKEIALAQAEVIKVKAEELYNYAVEKGTPAVEKAASEVRKQALKVLKDLQEKIEETEKKDKKGK